MNISADINHIGSQAAGLTAHKAKEQAKYLNAGGETSEIAPVSGNDAFSQKLSDVFRRENSDLIHGLSELSDADRKEIAANAYFQMQGRVYQAIKREEADITTFSALKDEKAYYTDLLGEAQGKGSTKISGGKYGFRDSEDGTQLSVSDIEKQLEDVQGRIDKLVNPYGGDDGKAAVSAAINQSAEKSFAAYAAVFEGITGLKSDALNATDDLLIHKTDRSEENFISKANESIESLKSQSEGLRTVKKLFFGQVGEDEESSRLSEEAMVKMAVFEFFREKFAYGGDADELYDQLKGMTLLDVRA